ncbi:hypothetical protein [Kiloniella antarctica]|uniref:Solute-binding protein family 3/N-terminal domain-containing protein n=1 Tax=Kiloniella antarctica TaxID=1550907 RepID=A0ABW5BNH4_9PROT
MKLLNPLFRVVFFFCSLLLTSQSLAEVVCPKSIAIIGDSILAEQNLETLQSVYSDLGCDILIERLPGRRGIASFNNHTVDGEMYRLAIAEPRYTRNFVRSEIPLFQHSGSLWLHPNHTLRDSLPTGYTLGIVWHEKYMERRRGKLFKTVEDVYEAYNKGEIGSFVSSDFSVLHNVSEGKFIIAPDQGESIMRAPLYHYLGAEFSPFMKLFSDYLRKNTPFSLSESKVFKDIIN